MTAPSYIHAATLLALREGETCEGIVLRLPAAGVPHGRQLFLVGDDGAVYSLPAVARAGWAVLEKSLVRERVRPGDRIAVSFLGWRATADGERRYRDTSVVVLDRQAVTA